MGERCERCGAKLQAERLARRGKKLRRACDAAAEVYNAAQSAYRSAAQAARAQSKAVSTAQDALQEAQQFLAEYRHQVADQARLDAQQARLSQALQDLRTPRPSAAEAEAQQAAQTLRADIRQLKVLLSQGESDLRHLRFWVEGFGPAGVQSHLLDHVVPHLNRHAQTVAQQLASDLRVEFVTQQQLKGGGVRDKFTLQVTNAHGATDYAGQSQGERRKVDIVVALALQNLVQGSARCNLAIWDEVTDGLDEASSDAVMGLLRAQGKTRDTTLVISHAAWLQAHFPHTLRVIKEQGCSRLEHLTAV